MGLQFFSALFLLFTTYVNFCRKHRPGLSVLSFLFQPLLRGGGRRNYILKWVFFRQFWPIDIFIVESWDWFTTSSKDLQGVRFIKTDFYQILSQKSSFLSSYCLLLWEKVVKALAETLQTTCDKNSMQTSNTENTVRQCMSELQESMTTMTSFSTSEIVLIPSRTIIFMFKLLPRLVC